MTPPILARNSEPEFTKLQLFNPTKPHILVCYGTNKVYYIYVEIK